MRHYLDNGQRPVGCPDWRRGPGSHRTACTPATTNGLILREGDPGVQPQLISPQGLGAVPVWFASGSELQGAISDGELLTDEL